MRLQICLRSMVRWSRRLLFLAALSIAALCVVACTRTEEGDTILPPDPRTPLVVLSLHSLGDGHSVEALVTVYGGTAPYLVGLSWGDGYAETLQGTSLRSVHEYATCGLQGNAAVGWPVEATATDVDGRRSATATGTATPCLP